MGTPPSGAAPRPAATATSPGCKGNVMVRVETVSGLPALSHSTSPNWGTRYPCHPPCFGRMVGRSNRCCLVLVPQGH